MKKEVDLASWPRRAQYELFRQMDYPQFNICCNLDITELRAHTKRVGESFFDAMMFLAVKTANGIPEFRYRMQGERVVEYDVTHPSFTLMTQPDVFSFCTVAYDPDYRLFTKAVESEKTRLAGTICLTDEAGRDDLIFITSIPWISFTSMSHPIRLAATDSVPRLSWGRFFQEGESLKLPFSIQVNHALMDGVHVGRYVERLQERLSNPERELDGVRPVSDRTGSGAEEN